MKIIGYYNHYGYRIEDNLDGEVWKIAFNISRMESLKAGKSLTP